jgi:hypothetical protein
MEQIINPQQRIAVFFYEEIILLGQVISKHRNKEDLIFRMAKMLDWVYRRHNGQIGAFENEIIEQLLVQPYKPHLSTIYLLEKHFPEKQGEVTKWLIPSAKGKKSPQKMSAAPATTGPVPKTIKC